MRFRFAPSPTGYLHIGNARTAIINYLMTQKEKGELIIRVEDTDMERSSKESEESILADLKWLGLEWNEGPYLGGDHGPYRQSERFDIYKEYTEKLLQNNNAYKCYCYKEELDEKRKEAEAKKEVFTYPGTCSNLSKEEQSKFESEGKKPVIRFRVPQDKKIVIDDKIKGSVEFNSENIGGDFIIVRSDGVPVYNYIVIIDDTLMKIDRVIRGEDHLSNTPKQVLVGEALGLPIPEYAHLALVHGEDRSKLSKRHGITSVDLYKKEGYLPEALVNYIAMLGWATESGEEILSKEDLIKEFDISKLGKSAAIFDFKKLKWMNGQHIRNYDLEKITELFIPYIKDAGYKTDEIEKSELKKLIDILRNYCDTLSDIKTMLPIFLDDVSIPDDVTNTMLENDYSIEVIKAAKELFDTELTEDNFTDAMINSIKEKSAQKGKKLFMPIRAMITGRLKGPDMDRAIPQIGFNRCKQRIQYCFDKYVD